MPDDEDVAKLLAQLQNLDPLSKEAAEINARLGKLILDLKKLQTSETIERCKHPSGALIRHDMIGGWFIVCQVCGTVVSTSPVEAAQASAGRPKGARTVAGGCCSGDEWRA